MPKVSLGPIIIILCGANMKSIIIMALLISIIITISNVYNGFSNTDENKIKLLKSLGATKFQILKILVIPSNYSVIINSLKINVSMSLIGVIMGEFLVSKKGIDYIIKYGSNTLYINLLNHSIIATSFPIRVANIKLINVSYMVINIWLNKLLLLYREIIVFITLLGLEYIKGFINSFWDKYSYINKNTIRIVICVIWTSTFFLFSFFI